MTVREGTLDADSLCHAIEAEQVEGSPGAGVVVSVSTSALRDAALQVLGSTGSPLDAARAVLPRVVFDRTLTPGCWAVRSAWSA